MKKVTRFGVRTGIFDCSLDWRFVSYCHSVLIRLKKMGAMRVVHSQAGIGEECWRFMELVTEVVFEFVSSAFEDVVDSKFSEKLPPPPPHTHTSDETSTVVPRSTDTKCVNVAGRDLHKARINFDSVVSRLCDRKRWHSSRLIMGLPQGHKAKDNVMLRSYTGSTKIQAVLDWVNYNLASRIR